MAKNIGFSPQELCKLEKLVRENQTALPKAWYLRLYRTSKQQKQNWHVCGGGYGIEWEDIDEHLSVEGLLRGAPAPNYHAEEVA